MRAARSARVPRHLQPGVSAPAPSLLSEQPACSLPCRSHRSPTGQPTGGWQRLSSGKGWDPAPRGQGLTACAGPICARCPACPAPCPGGVEVGLEHPWVSASLWESTAGRGRERMWLWRVDSVLHEISRVPGMVREREALRATRPSHTPGQPGHPSVCQPRRGPPGCKLMWKQRLCSWMPPPPRLGLPLPGHRMGRFHGHAPQAGLGGHRPGGDRDCQHGRGWERTRKLHGPPRLHAARSPSLALREDILPASASESHRATKERLGCAKSPTSTCLLSHEGGGTLSWQRADSSAGLPAHPPVPLCLSSGELRVEGTRRGTPDRSRPLAIVMRSGMACDSEWTNRNSPEV